MLVHKRTMGVLDLYWTGRYRTAPDGIREPVMREYVLAGSGLDPDEWWEVPRRTPLGKQLRRLYPFCTAIVGADGELLGVSVPQKPRPVPPPGRRQRRRRGGLLEHIL